MNAYVAFLVLNVTKVPRFLNFYVTDFCFYVTSFTHLEIALREINVKDIISGVVLFTGDMHVGIVLIIDQFQLSK